MGGAAHAIIMNRGLSLPSPIPTGVQTGKLDSFLLMFLLAPAGMVSLQVCIFLLVENATSTN